MSYDIPVFCGCLPSVRCSFIVKWTVFRNNLSRKLNSLFTSFMIVLFFVCLVRGIIEKRYDELCRRFQSGNPESVAEMYTHNCQLLTYGEQPIYGRKGKQWWIQGFSRGMGARLMLRWIRRGANPFWIFFLKMNLHEKQLAVAGLRGGSTYYLTNFFPKTVWKKKEILRREGGVPRALSRSATGFTAEGCTVDSTLHPAKCPIGDYTMADQGAIFYDLF